MNGTFKKVMSAGLAAAMVLSMAACGSSSSSTASSSAATSSAAASTTAASTTEATPVSGGTLKIGVRAAISTLGYAGKLSSANDQFCAAPCIETLCRYDTEGNIVPWLCESYEEDTEKATLTIKLRDNVYFHDGTKCDADAVAYVLNDTITARKANFQCGSIEITSDGNLTVTVQMPTYTSDVAETLLVTSYGYIESAEYLKANGSDAAIKNPVGTGPYKFVSWDGDTKIVYEKNDSYWGTSKPMLDTLEIYCYADNATIAAAYQAGEIDVIARAASGVVTTLQTAGIERLDKIAPVGNSFYYLVMTSNEGCGLPTEDVRVRQAIAYGCDWKTIAQSFSNAGSYEYTNQWAAPGSEGYNNDIVGYEYNVDKAKELLKDAGYSDGFTMDFYVTAGNADYVNIATYAQSYLAEIGITINIQQVEQSVMNQITLKDMNGITIASHTMNIDNCRMITSVFTQNSGTRNAYQLPNLTDVQALGKQALASKDLSYRVSQMKEMNKLVVDTYCGIIPILTYGINFFVRDNVHAGGFNETYPVSWTPETIWVSK